MIKTFETELRDLIFDTQINCFQDVVTEHPPLDCTEPDMYHCFCKMTDLQQYFVECAYSDCPSTADGADAVGFGVELCAGMESPVACVILSLEESSTNFDRSRLAHHYRY